MKPKLYVAQEICHCCGSSTFYLQTIGKNPAYFENLNDELVEKPFKSIFSNPIGAAAAAKAMGYDVFDNIGSIL